LFALAFVMLAAAEYQLGEQGNLAVATVYGIFGGASLVYAVVLRQRLRMAR
jgi:hypothetical protein